MRQLRCLKKERALQAEQSAQEGLCGEAGETLRIPGEGGGEIRGVPMTQDGPPWPNPARAEQLSGISPGQCLAGDG